MQLNCEHDMTEGYTENSKAWANAPADPTIITVKLFFLNLQID